MERYTKKDGDGYYVINGEELFEDQCENYCGPAADRLAAYEDTGLEPGEVSDFDRLVKLYLEAGLDKQFVLACIEATKAGMIVDRLRELAQADREGRCVVLPAKVDETVYQVKKGDDCPRCFRLEGVDISEDGVITYPMYWGESFVLNDFGTNLFRTYGEAESALRREHE